MQIIYKKTKMHLNKTQGENWNWDINNIDPGNAAMMIHGTLYILPRNEIWEIWNLTEEQIDRILHTK